MWGVSIRHVFLKRFNQSPKIRFNLLHNSLYTSQFHIQPPSKSRVSSSHPGAIPLPNSKKNPTIRISPTQIHSKSYANAAEEESNPCSEGEDEGEAAEVTKIEKGEGHENYLNLHRRQLDAETEAWKQASREYRELILDMCKHRVAPNLPYMKSLFLQWFGPLREAIMEDQKTWEGCGVRVDYGIYISQLPADVMAVITMHQLISVLMTGIGYGVGTVMRTALAIGSAVEQEVRVEHFLQRRERSRSRRKGDKKLSVEEEKAERLRKKVNMLIKKNKIRQARYIVNMGDDFEDWGPEARLKLGCRLLHHIMQTAHILSPSDGFGGELGEIRPAFSHTMKVLGDDKLGTKKYGVIECDPLIRKGLEESGKIVVIPYMPMLVPPINWTRYDRGAYFVLPSYVMRTHGVKVQGRELKKTPPERLDPIFKALNTLGSVKWRVSRRVLVVVERVWAEGGGLGDLVDREDVPIPEKPDTNDVEQIMKWKWGVKAVKKENREMHSRRCDIELKLAVARKMMEEKWFFYPHNLDFRGRAYPMHPHLNHLGSDLCRSVLEFAEGRVLGHSGLRWLKIHLANLFGNGFDKLSNEGRLEFVENNLDDIFDSAENPFEGRRWWVQAEAPFQCLATCMNLTEALKNPSPELTISHIPVHQDGSCNGLQHYAALGRDKLGAVAVNLVTAEKPADVYSGIASMVFEIIQKDSEKDPSSHPKALIARDLLSHVDRKLVKQTVMTSVYGVTYVGAREQIRRRLKERGALNDDARRYSASSYVAKTTLAALGEMFNAARSIMKWLGECARIIALSNQPVRWTTPLGLPVVQPYQKNKRNMVTTTLQILAIKTNTEKVLVQRHKTAFPPNFIHSLDGCHMMMTAVACNEAGIHFAGVHDSYWTHACDVDELNRILRVKFVELYEAPVLENLLSGFKKSFPDLNFPPLPNRGDFDLREVLNSTYFFN